MPTRSRTTFKKRQKEMARQEKQRDKQAKRLERKETGGAGSGPEIADRSTLDEFGLPLDASPNREDEAEVEEQGR